MGNVVNLPLVTASGLSGSVDLTGTIDLASVGPYHINARNEHLILSSSAGSQVTVSGSVLGFGEINPTIKLPTNGTLVHLIGGTNALITTATTHTINASAVIGASTGRIHASTAHLVLSSSAGSTVYVSGTITTGNASMSAAGTVQANGGSGLVSNSGLWLSAGNFVHNSSIKIMPQTGQDGGDLILSSSDVSAIVVSGTMEFATQNRGYSMLARNNHLILSSSVGSVVALSGALGFGAAFTSASLPAAPKIGTIAFVEDMGCVAVYTGTDKWLRISSGSF